MIERFLFKTLKKALERQPAVVLVGPRQVGKTTLALQVAQGLSAIYLDLESPLDLHKLEEPLFYLKSHEDKLVILDEIQQKPELFKALRGLIDERRYRGHKAGHFLLLGSASLDLLRQSSETLAGRIAELELTPITALEINNTGIPLNNLWIRGGFPESLLAKTDADSFEWRLDFIKSYLERDIPQLGPRIPTETLRRFWTMLAHLQGSIANFSQIGSSIGLSGQSITRYVDLLVDLLLVRRLAPYHANIKKRLIKSPKIYVRDSGLMHTLLNIRTMEELLENPIGGASWEGFVIENCLGSAPSTTNAYFYKTSSGAEIDLLLELPNKELWAIEIKKGYVPKVEKGFYSALEDIQPHRSFVIYGGTERYHMAQNVDAIGLEDFLAILRDLGSMGPTPPSDPKAG